MARPEPKMKRARLEEEQAKGELGAGRRGRHQPAVLAGLDGQQRGGGGVAAPAWGRVQGDHEQPGGDEQPGDLGAAHRGDGAKHQGDGPQPGVALVGQARELCRGDDDDGHDGRGDTVEQRLHHRQALVVDVDDGDG
jgi:hypothetical protein